MSSLLNTPHSVLRKYDGMKIYNAGSGAEARTVGVGVRACSLHASSTDAGYGRRVMNTCLPGPRVADRHQKANTNFSPRSGPAFNVERIGIDKRIFMHRTLMITHHPDPPRAQSSCSGHNGFSTIQPCARKRGFSVADGQASTSPVSA